MQKLEGALGGAWVAVAETEIGIDDADQIELGKMMTFGDQLGADHDIEFALRDVVELAAQTLDRFDQIAGENERARAGKKLGRLLLQPLDAGADRDEAFGRLTFRALRRQRRREAAQVTDQPPLEAVIDQPAIAIRAMHAMAAGAA